MSGTVVDKLLKFLSHDFRKQVEKRDKLRKILATMREKQKALEAELAEEYDPQLQEDLRARIRLLKEQRRKGLEVLDELRSAHKQDS